MIKHFINSAIQILFFPLLHSPLRCHVQLTFDQEQILFISWRCKNLAERISNLDTPPETIPPSSLKEESVLQNVV